MPTLLYNHLLDTEIARAAGGYILQAIGLETTTAAHGSFTGTIMVLIVPVLVGLSGRRVAKSTWIGALFALLGRLPLRNML